MKAISLLVNSYLPPELRNYSETYDVKSMNRIMRAVAEKYPDRFAEITKKISDLGRTASYVQGETITLKDLEPVIDKKGILDEMAAEIKALPRDSSFIQRRREIYQKYTDRIEKETANNALKNRNNIALAVMSGARGKMPQLRAMISPVGTYSDYKGVPIDVYSKESFADGIRPATFLASTYGSRASVISTKSSTAKGGDLAKQFASVAGDMIIRKDDCGTGNGIALAPDDPSLRGRVLAQDVGNFKAGTVITREMAATLGKSGVKYIMARSPLTCSCANGLCAKCVGKLYRGGKMPRVGDAVGLIASTTSMEPVTQMALCLSPDTKVITRRGKKSIKDIYRGDEVLAFSFIGLPSFVPVVDKYKNASVYLRKYTLEREGKKVTVLCSERHEFLTPGDKKTPISLCYIRDIPIGVREGKEVRWYHVVKRSEEFFSEAYDIEIATVEHLFILANGVITSNSAKHTAGMTQGKKSYSGLAVIQQFTQSPEKFKDVGVVSEVDGKVDSVEEAPQGGTYVTVSGERHYIPAGHEVQVQPGQTVEAGDQLAEGLVDAEDVVRLKGLGAGRKYYAERLNKILEDSGAKTDKRNTEILARAAIRHVRINSNEGLGNYLPDDVVDYSALEGSYVARDAVKKRAKDAVGGYLARPVMHYTIGTRITPSVAKDLEEHNYSEVETSSYEPEFTPEMQRLRTASHANQDWLASLTTSYLTQQLNESSTRGDDTNVKENTDYRPRIMYGEGFGKRVGETGEF